MLFHSAKKPFELTITNLNQAQEKQVARLKSAAKSGEKSRFCPCLATGKKSKKAAAKDENSKTVYVLDFHGDIKASAAERLREEISVIIASANEADEVVLRLESAGGQVHSYGLAAAQLARIKAAGLQLTVCVDKVAASGGYMMACVADKIIATPFSVVGSIGVLSQMPNFHEWLKKHDIDVEMFTAGEYKRTVTMVGKNSDEDRAKHQADLERIHALFKSHISEHRPSLDIEKVATGEYWLGTDALDLGLVDALGTSDAYILSQMAAYTVLHLHSHQKPTLVAKLGLADASLHIKSMVDGAKSWVAGGALNQRLPL